MSRTVLKRALLSIHNLAARFGVHVLPIHYYSPIPDLRELERTRRRWARASEMPGIDVDVDRQLAILRDIATPHSTEFEGNPHFKVATEGHFGPGFGYVEAQVLHAVVRSLKPRLIVEVGSGVSTYCMLQALEMNRKETQQAGRLVSIEPHPSAALRALPGIELIGDPVQEVPMSLFSTLGEGDLLFIDSSHTVKTGGDVNYIVLEVLPRLQKGVVVHFHDINFPYDYQRDVLKTFLHWSESSLLQAFLVNNERFEILTCLSMLHYARPKDLEVLFPEYRPQPGSDGLQPDAVPPFATLAEHFPASIYLRVRDQVSRRSL